MTKIEPADQFFSYYVRLRDRECVRCHAPVGFNAKGLPNTFTVSHYFGRTAQTTRFSLENCDTACRGCHSYWEERNKKAYTDFKREQLGEKAFDELVLLGNATLKQLGMRKDYKMQELYWTARILEDFGIKV